MPKGDHMVTCDMSTHWTSFHSEQSETSSLVQCTHAKLSSWCGALIQRLSKTSCIHMSICGRLCSSPYGRLQSSYHPRSPLRVCNSASIKQNHKMCLSIQFREPGPPYFYPRLLIGVIKLLFDARRGRYAVIACNTQQDDMYAAFVVPCRQHVLAPGFSKSASRGYSEV